MGIIQGIDRDEVEAAGHVINDDQSDIKGNPVETASCELMLTMMVPEYTYPWSLGLTAGGGGGGPGGGGGG
jgi:hypothetical protein